MAGMPVFFFQKEGALSLIHIYVYKRQALTNTLIIAVITAVCATILGTAAAIGIRSMNKWVKRVVMNLTNLPMVNPEIVTGVSMLLLFVFLHDRLGILKPGMATLVIAHITFCLPYVVLNVMPKLRQMDPHLYEAAQEDVYKRQVK